MTRNEFRPNDKKHILGSGWPILHRRTGTFYWHWYITFFNARCTLVQSAVLRSHVVCLSVCPSVTLVNWDHIGWNSSKIISPLVSLGRSLFATPTWRVCSKGNTPNCSVDNAERSSSADWRTAGIDDWRRRLFVCNLPSCTAELFQKH